MKPALELLAQGGDLESIKAAIAAGADAVYCGVNKFNARNRAANLEFEELKGVIHLAHDHGCRVFLTLNILIMGSEFPALVRLLNKLVNTHIDGVIVQDLGLFYLLSKFYPNLDIHASTQMNTHNGGQIKFISRLTASRVNLSRELNINEIQALTRMGNAHSMSTEAFVHGSYCIGFSGLCYMSSVHGGNSGNRGRCSQPCRDKYLTTPVGKNFPLNLKDNSAHGDLKELSDAGVGSLKIEGRIKQFDYVYTVVSSWKKQLHDFLWKRLGIINDTQYDLNHLDLDNLELDLFISFNEITALRKRVFTRLNGSRETIAPVDLPFLTKPPPLETAPALSVLIDDTGDLPLCSQISGDVFFQLPNGLNHDLDEYIDLFTRNQELIPWFPSVLMGEHYDAAKKLMEQVPPRQILTNNTGIAHGAYEKNIPWLAGPYMNMVNSFSLLCLQEKFNCAGVFMSNELSKFQIKRIIRPKDFKLYTSIYHPILTP
jgi:U32 family peptidase